ncbi:glycoside hydrolase family 3 C-terminal domain-containing protein [Ruminiclostridium cellulolyticum]|uniref:Glycoside hydrolase family 3 domain protein n=1 Tax=Ruminiclostridium cellulolyticum (strain ATCC 35319 / DSM 5812 / JCM 6584 / H10) TaxID=394503 RepID=B8I618_RUMCH|nr:glycoside hydrolase family 3 C-terminal domain-containing protein [Ruminiclostridium cellulolyticum]ACL76783.1 glycoside hydrolase family 3 domain protein [Ruminiclostridium cellulolyticum H10]
MQYDQIDKKIDELLSMMTLEEKAGMCHGAGLFRTAGVPRLGIPPLVFSDGPMGIRNEFADDNWNTVGGNTDFVTYLPANTALAATFNRTLAESLGEVLGCEARGRGKDVILAPGVNIIRTPLCGRNYEYFSEDPILTAELAASFIKGVQRFDVAACVKHFAANNQETERLAVSAEVDELTLRELYFPAFEASVRAGVLTVMTAYNRLNGTFCSHSRQLITEILREEWGFNGVVVSDWGAVHDTESPAIAGLDIEMNVTSNFNEYFFAKPLINAIKDGKIPERMLDDKVRRILRLMFRLNMFSKDRKRGGFNLPQHQQAVLDAAKESFVLLKNDREVLPLNADGIKTVAVIGSNADKKHSSGGDSAAVKALYEVTPLSGIVMRLASGAKVTYYPGCPDETHYKEEFHIPSNADEKTRADIEEKARAADEDYRKIQMRLEDEAIQAAKTADAVIFIGGNGHEQESEGRDRPDMALPYEQDKLLSRVLDANPNTVVVIISGSPVNMSGWIDKAPTVMQGFFSGMHGGTALAAVLFGDENPSGHLPFTIPLKEEETGASALGEYPGGETVCYSEGLFVGYRYHDAFNIPPLFPFGYGLSYTTFSLANESFRRLPCVGTEYEIHVDITNSGNRPGAQSVQLYVEPEKKDGSPIRTLKGFEKTYLNPDETKTITFKLDERTFSEFRPHEGWVFVPGNYTIHIGTSSRELPIAIALAL